MSIDEEFAEASVPVTPAQPAAVAQATTSAAAEEAMPSVPVQPIAIAVPAEAPAAPAAAKKSAEDLELERLMAETGMAQ